MEILRAKPQDADALTQIALAAKRHWGYSDHRMVRWRELLTMRPEYIAAQEVYGALRDGRTVGFYGLLAVGNKLRLEHLWVLPEAMGCGIGRALFNHGVERAKDLGFENMEIESDPNAEGFYQRMGARRVSVRITESDGERREVPLLLYHLT